MHGEKQTMNREGLCDSLYKLKLDKERELITKQRLPTAETPPTGQWNSFEINGTPDSEITLRKQHWDPQGGPKEPLETWQTPDGNAIRPQDTARRGIARAVYGGLSADK